MIINRLTENAKRVLSNAAIAACVTAASVAVAQSIEAGLRVCENGKRVFEDKPATASTPTEKALKARSFFVILQKR
jgi:hypothetical protein